MNDYSITKRVYLDFAAATPLLPAAKAAMEPFLTEDFGNPSAIHEEGKRSRIAVEEARTTVARALHVRPEFITFIGGGTEGNTLALAGTIERLRQAGREYSDMEIITTAIEHPSIIRTVEYLQKLGIAVKFVTVDGTGVVNLTNLQELVTPKTVLFSVAYANSEIGVVQPLHSIGQVLKKAESRFNTTILFHVDAAQAPLWLSCHFDTLGADLVVLDASKCCGPKGVGVLVRSRRVQLASVMFGGGQEQGLRPGTENVAGIVGASVAIAWAQADWRLRAEQVRLVRDEAINLLLHTVPGLCLNGPTGEERIANNINISISGLDTEYTAVWLDSRGFSVSTKSACAGADGGESMVVKIISEDAARASSTLRFTLGPQTSIQELEVLVSELKVHITMMSGVEKNK